MALTYRTSGPWGPGQGSNLSPVQVDDNFYYLIQQIITLSSEISGGAVVSISTISVTGNQMTIVLTNGANFVFTLPTAQFRPRGDWQPLTAYAVNDLVNFHGSVYLVIFAHTSAATFDPNANDGMGHDYYGLLLSQTTAPVETTALATFTPAITDADCYIRCTNGFDGCTVILPANSVVPFPIGTELHFRDETGFTSGGGIVFVDSSPVEINLVHGYLPSTATVGATVTLKKVGTDSWDIFGLLAVGASST